MWKFCHQNSSGWSKKCLECGSHTEPIKEEAYFLRLSKYSDKLLEHIKNNEKFILPISRKNEVVKFIESGVNDLCVSRTSIKWGVEVKSNPKHVVYVWIDALSNYITALGYKSDDETMFNDYWKNNEEVIHIMGKDILRFHAIYWPVILMCLNIKLPKTIFAHNWIMMKDGKMSKSKGNVIYPEELVEKYGADALRYYLLSSISTSSDGTFTPEEFIVKINADLANGLGNLINRTLAMSNKYFGGTVSKSKNVKTSIDKHCTNLERELKETIEEFEKNIDNYSFADLMTTIVSYISKTNKFADLTEPWFLAKDEDKKEDLNKCLYYMLEAIRNITTLTDSFLVNLSEKVCKQLGLDMKLLNWENLKFGVVNEYKVVTETEVLFPRLDTEEEIKYIQSLIK